MIAIIGILMLIGIVKKNAIMMIDFALDAQRNQHMAPADAIREACVLRFRPIMMTTLAALMGALPIALGRRRTAPAARPGRGRRADLLASHHALHHSGDLPLPRQIQRQRADGRRRAARGHPTAQGAGGAKSCQPRKALISYGGPEQFRSVCIDAYVIHTVTSVKTDSG
jgi:hypothetical protein